MPTQMAVAPHLEQAFEGDPSALTPLFSCDVLPGWQESESPDALCCAAGPSWQGLYHRLRVDLNDPEAFEELERRVGRWANQNLASPIALRAAREDVVEETCATVLLRLEDAYGSATFAGFVYGHYLNARRRALRAARIVSIPLDEVEIAAPSHDEELELDDERTMLHRCLMSLPPRERRAIELRYFDEASSAEIAASLGVSECNARQIVFKGLGRLRKLAGALQAQDADLPASGAPTRLREPA